MYCVVLFMHSGFVGDNSSSTSQEVDLTGHHIISHHIISHYALYIMEKTLTVKNVSQTTTRKQISVVIYVDLRY